MAAYKPQIQRKGKAVRVKKKVRKPGRKGK